MNGELWASVNWEPGDAWFVWVDGTVGTGEEVGLNELERHWLAASPMAAMLESDKGLSSGPYSDSVRPNEEDRTSPKVLLVVQNC